MSRTNLDLFCWYINVKHMKALPMKDLLVILRGTGCFFFSSLDQCTGCIAKYEVQEHL